MKMTDEQRKLVEDNYGLIFAFMKKYKLGTNEIVDWYGIISLALCNAAMHYDESRGTTFSTYAYCVIENAVKNALRKEKQKNAKIPFSLDEPLRSQDGDECGATYGDIIADPRDDYSEFLLLDEVKKNLSMMSNRNRSMIEDIMTGNTTLAEVGSKYGVSGQAASTVMNKFRRRISKSIGISYKGVR